MWSKSENQYKWSWKFIWKLHIPPNVKLFLWKVHTEILPTRSLLCRRIGSQFNDSQCVLCGHSEETQEHMLWKCTWARLVWQEILIWWGLLGKVYIE